MKNEIQAYPAPLLQKLTAGNDLEILTHLSRFKELGRVKMDLVLAVPSAERLPALAAQNRPAVLVTLAAAIKKALQNIKVKNGPDDTMIVEIADRLIDESNEDNLALEDVLLFLQELTSGKTGPLYDRLDMPTFFEHLETYRQRRWEALQNIRYEKEQQFKAMGGGGARSSEGSEETNRLDSFAGALNFFKENLKTK